MDLGLFFQAKSNENIQGSDQQRLGGNCLDTSRPTGGWISTLGGSPGSWNSKRQVTVVLSSCDAESMAASEATKEGHLDTSIWFRILQLPHLLGPDHFHSQLTTPRR